MNSNDSVSIHQVIVGAEDVDERKKEHWTSENVENKVVQCKKVSSIRRSGTVRNRGSYGADFLMMIERFFATLEFSRPLAPLTYSRKQQNLLTEGRRERERDPPGIIFVKAKILIPKNVRNLLEPVSTGGKELVKNIFPLSSSGERLAREKFSHRCKRIFRDGSVGLLESATWQILKTRTKDRISSRTQTDKLLVPKLSPPGKIEQRLKVSPARYEFAVYDILKRLRDLQRAYYSGAKKLLNSKKVKRLQYFSRHRETRNLDVCRSEGKKLLPKEEDSRDKRGARHKKESGGQQEMRSNTSIIETIPSGKQNDHRDEDGNLSSNTDFRVKKKAYDGTMETPTIERWPLNMYLYRKYLSHKRNLLGKKADTKDKRELFDSAKHRSKLKPHIELDKKNKSIEVIVDTVKVKSGEVMVCPEAKETEKQDDSPSNKTVIEENQPEEVEPHIHTPKKEVKPPDISTYKPRQLTTTDKYGFFILDGDTSITLANGVNKKPQLTNITHRRYRSKNASKSYEVNWETLVEAWSYSGAEDKRIHQVIWPRTKYSDFVSPRSKRIINLCKGGIPNRLRGKVWYHLANCESNKVAGLFDELLEKFEDVKSSMQIFDIIERDITRCYPQHTMFADKYGSGQSNLRNILKAYALYRPQVGYCQGMGMLVGVMLMHLSPEDSFWLLVQTLNMHLDDYYTPGLCQLKIDAEVFDNLLKKVDKKAFKHFESQGVTSLMYITKWFLTLYTTTLPWEIVLRAWDLFYAEGVKSLFRIGLAVIRLNSGYLLEHCPTNSEILSFLLNIPRDKVVPDRLIECALNIKLKKKNIQKLRNYQASIVSSSFKSVSG